MCSWQLSAVFFTTRKYVFDVTSLGQRLPCNSVKDAITFHLECKLRSSYAQFILWKMHSTNSSASIEAKYWVSSGAKSSRSLNVKASYKLWLTALAFVILCNKRWLEIEETARKKSVLPRCLSVSIISVCFAQYRNTHPSNSVGQQGFAAAGRAVQQEASGRRDAECLEHFWVSHVHQQLGHLAHCLLTATHVRKRDLRCDRFEFWRQWTRKRAVEATVERRAHQTAYRPLTDSATDRVKDHIPTAFPTTYRPRPFTDHVSDQLQTTYQPP